MKIQTQESKIDIKHNGKNKTNKTKNNQQYT